MDPKELKEIAARLSTLALLHTIEVGGLEESVRKLTVIIEKQAKEIATLKKKLAATELAKVAPPYEVPSEDTIAALCVMCAHGCDTPICDQCLEAADKVFRNPDAK